MQASCVYQFSNIIESDRLHIGAADKKSVDRYAEAVRFYDEAVKLYPDSARVWESRGEAKRMLGWLSEAIHDFNQAIELDPRYVLAWQGRGTAKLSCNRNGEAIQDYDQALKLDSRHAGVWRNRGQAKLSLKHFALAIQDYDEAIKLDKKSAVAWRFRGLAKQSLGRNREALTDYDQTLKLIPGWAAVWSDRGRVKSFLRRKNEAIQDFDQALKLAPKIAMAWLGRGLLKANLGHYREALTDYDNTLKLEPAWAAAWCSRGKAKASLGRYDEAIHDYDEAIKLDCKNTVAWYGRGVANENLQCFPEALLDYDQAIKLDSKQAKVWRSRGYVKRLLGRHNDALLDYDQALKLDATFAGAWCGRGKAKALLGRCDEAIQDYDEAIKLDSNNAVACYGRGVANHELGHYSHALNDFERALQLEPSNQKFRASLDHTQKAMAKSRAIVMPTRPLSKPNAQLSPKAPPKQAKKVPAKLLPKSSPKIPSRQVKKISGKQPTQFSPKLPSKQAKKVPGKLPVKSSPKIPSTQVKKTSALFAPFSAIQYTSPVLSSKTTGSHNSSFPNTNSLDESQYIAPIESVLPAPQAKAVSYKIINWGEVEQGELIGQGGFGQVFKGKWQGNEVAVKRLTKQMLEEHEVATFEAEANIMSQCKHPNIVSIYGACNQQGHYALILEYHPKKSLYDCHNRQEDIPWYPQRWQIAIDISWGISFLHSNNIVHRDIKSLNVLLDNNFRAKISDFGMAKVKTSSTSTSSAKKMIGTGRWRAPELVNPQNPTRPNKQSDVYALGLTLWEVYAQRVPYHDAPDDITIMFWIFSGKLVKLGNDCPDALANIIKQCIKKEPAERPLVNVIASALEQAMLIAKKTAHKANAKSWHFDSRVKEAAKTCAEKPYVLLDAAQSDIDKVRQFYSHHPIPGMDIGRIQIVYNPEQNRKFVAQLSGLQQRNQSSAFSPQWSIENHPKWREAVAGQCDALALPYYDNNYPDVKLLPMWHGTKKSLLDSIFRTGYAILSTGEKDQAAVKETDPGYFGKGIYSAYEAEYSYRAYSSPGCSGALLLNWVSFYSAYPVIDGDMVRLSSKGNYKNYDAHFIPVVPESDSPHELIYYPTKPNQKHRYTEVVVFESAQCLPRYVVELAKNEPMKNLPNMGFFAKSSLGFDLLQAAQYAYDHCYSKPYDLPKVDGINWQMDWTYSYKNRTVERPNHGLSHAMSMAAYVPYVVSYYCVKQQLSAQERKILEQALPWLQLCSVFFVAGRRNELGFKHNPVVYQQFRERSGMALADYLRCIGFANQHLVSRFQDLVVNCYSKQGHLNRILAICHDIDLLRCVDFMVYREKLDGIAEYLGQHATEQLARLALSLVQNRGDRVMGYNNLLRGYQGEQFVVCSTDVNRCQEQIERGIQAWKQSVFGVSTISAKLGAGI